MTTARSSHLTLLAPLEWGVITRIGDHAGDVIQPAVWKRKALKRRGFLQRFDQLATIAPDAPLSCLVVDVTLPGAQDTEPDAVTMRSVTDQVLLLTRPMDVVGEIQNGVLAIVLQGSGATAASAVTARLQFHLNHLRSLPVRLHVDVFTATGTGANGRSLLNAAMESLLDAG